MSAKHDEFFSELQLAIEEDRLVLPSLPEVVLKIRDVLEDENATTEQVADVLSQDSSLSARLLKVVNSPLYRGSVSIEDLHTAVTRMGGRLVRDLIINLAMKQMFQPTSLVMDQQFRSAWNTSVDVAAICQMMASSIGGIRKEQALLAGLIHNIGILPILVLAEEDDCLFHDEESLKSLTNALQARVGAMILKSWNFSDDLIEVVQESNNFKYDHDGAANLVDLVQFSLLHGGYTNSHQISPDDWSMVPAFSKLNIDPEVDVIHVEENQEIINDVKQSFAA